VNKKGDELMSQKPEAKPKKRMSGPLNALILTGTFFLGLFTYSTLQKMLEDSDLPLPESTELPREALDEFIDLNPNEGEWQIGGKSLASLLKKGDDHKSAPRLVEELSETQLLANRTSKDGKIVAEMINSKIEFVKLSERLTQAGWKVTNQPSSNGWRLDRDGEVRQIVELGGDEKNAFSYLIMRGVSSKPSENR
jgi:hypothetical protein